MQKNEFDNVKKETLHNISVGVDFSPKGSIDAPVTDIVKFINCLENYVTTSSCSGRMSLYFSTGDASKGVTWILVEHRLIFAREITAALSKKEFGSNSVFLKCEPFILHVQCRNLESARSLHETAMACGYRESGISMGKRKIMVAIRTTSFSMEMPLVVANISLLDDHALEVVVREANSRLRGNFARIDRLLLSLKSSHGWPTLGFSRELKSAVTVIPTTMSKEITTTTTASATIVDNGYILNRWGHTCISMKEGNVLVVGGYGQGIGGHVSRALPSFVLTPSGQNTKPCRIKLLEPGGGCSDPYVHAAGVRWRDTVLLFGGRESPNTANGTLRIARVSVSAGDGDWTTFRTVDDVVGIAPCARWGHTLTPVTPNVFLLVGGRDEVTVFNDSYLLQWKNHVGDGVQVQSEGEGGSWFWETITSKDKDTVNGESDLCISGPGPGPRFFHAASSLAIGEGKYVVVVTGGLQNLDNPLQSSSLSLSFPPHIVSTGPSVMVWLWNDDSTGSKGHWRSVPLQSASSSHVSGMGNESAVANNNASEYSFSCYFSVEAVFGHTLTDIGGKTLLLSGGTRFLKESYSQCRDLCLHVIGWDGSSIHANNNNISNDSDDNNNDNNNGVSDRDSISILVKSVKWRGRGGSEPMSSLPPCHGCRVHHQTVLTSPSTLMVLGGGSPCLAFGPHFCVPVNLTLGSSSLAENNDNNNIMTTTTEFDSDTLNAVEHNNAVVGGMTTVGSYDDNRHNHHGDGSGSDSGHISQSTTSSLSSSSSGPVLLAPRRIVKAMKTYLEKQRVSPFLSSSSLSDSSSIIDNHDSSISSRKDWKKCAHGWLDKRRRISEVDIDSITITVIPLTTDTDNDTTILPTVSHPVSVSAGDMAVPICDELASALRSNNTLDCKEAFLRILGTTVVHLGEQTCRPSRAIETNAQLHAVEYIQREGRRRGMSAESLDELPRKWETVGDVLLLPQSAMLGTEWDWVQEEDEGNTFWKELVTYFGAKRVARYSSVDSSARRESRIRLLYPPLGRPDATGPGSPGWVCVPENGIRFHFDITRVMFCSGNVTERMRMGRLQLQKEVVADLYCGIGYYSLPFLVHGHVSKLHAFEWNENSLLALKTNLSVTGVDPNRFVIHEGDNRVTAVSPDVDSIADRVCLGLLPSSEDGWPLAVRVMKPTGGAMHVHMNINQGTETEWTEHVCRTFETHFISYGKPMVVSCDHLEKVKSYAPLVNHVVADLRFKTQLCKSNMCVVVIRGNSS
eukprot:gene5987-12069_t